MNKKITIAGLGCGRKGDITLRTIEALKNADKVFLRTKIHPGIEILNEYNIEFETFDSYYENANDFDSLYQNIANEVLNAPYENIVYLVPGSSVYAEKAAILIATNSLGIQTEILPAVSFVEGIFCSLKTDALNNGYKIIDALSIDTQNPDPTCYTIACQVYDNITASQVKLALMEIYEEETDVLFINGALNDNEEIKKCKLYEIDRIKTDHLSTLIIPPVSYMKSLRTMPSFEELIAYLRSENGCPWDREQTHKSLIPNIIEEAYEVVEAIENEDEYALCEELGDLLLQVVLHAQIAKEEYQFNLNDVTESISKKLVHRHPHVFSNVKLENNDTIKLWDKIKAEEKHQENLAQRLSSVPKVLPALMYAQKIQGRASKVNFDFLSYKEAMNKIFEEIEELKDAINSNDKEKIENEAGDVLFSVVNTLRLLDINSEVVLRQSSKKFIARFEKLEKLLKKDNLNLEILDADIIDKYWEISKNIL